MKDLGWFITGFLLGVTARLVGRIIAAMTVERKFRREWTEY
jgi:hypothetical protein